MRTELEIKTELAELLKAEKPDYSAILALSNEFAQLDSEHVRFSVDAGLINRLGKELVGKGETAISELIKNAYDADATKVDLVFKNALKPGGTLIIEDDGVGMSYEELINGFMRISSSDKIHNPVSNKYKRRKAGRKGIGRFSTQRLGRELTIITQTENVDLAIRAFIKWDEFISDRNLTDISFAIDFIPKTKQNGTILIIDSLNDSWTDAAIKRAYKYTENLLIPEPLSSERKKWDNERNDPGFKANLYRDFISENNCIIDEHSAFYNHALAVIEGYIDYNGNGFWRMTSSKLDITNSVYQPIGKDRDNHSSKFSHIHDIYFKTYYFIYDSDLIPKSIFSYVKRLGNESGGIKLYRNGFRVPPYGENGNDWIGLDESVRRRTYIFPHQNQSFFGFVEIGDVSTYLFEETSSREGLVENEAYLEMTDFLYRAIIAAGLEIAAIREKKQTANQKNWSKRGKEKIKEGLEDLKRLTDSESTQDSEQTSDNDRQQQYRNIFQKISEGLDEDSSETQALIDENNMLRIFAALGLVIGEFVHEIKNYLPGFDAEISYLNDLLTDNKDAKERISLLKNNVDAFSSYTLYFDKSISRNVSRDLEPIHIKERINTFLNIIERNALKAHIKINTNLDDDVILLSDMTTIPMHPSEWASILFNLYTNSKKAIRKRGLNSGQIKIECWENDSKIFIDFSDNGCGVDPTIKDRIFDAFVTTTGVASQNSSDIDVHTGTGLGLKIISDILSSYNGSIRLKESHAPEYKTTFRIEIPKL